MQARLGGGASEGAAQGAAAEGAAACEGAAGEEGEEWEFEVAEELEDVIEVLLSALQDKDTIVRCVWGAVQCGVPCRSVE